MRRNPTQAEKTLWASIRKRALGVRVRRQIIIRGYIVDFYIPSCRLAIEVDGEVHDSRKALDAERDTNILKDVGIRVLRYSNKMVMEDIAIVVEDIGLAIIEQRATN